MATTIIRPANREEWESITEAENTLGINHISMVSNGIRKKCGGFIWKFKNI